MPIQRTRRWDKILKDTRELKFMKFQHLRLSQKHMATTFSFTVSVRADSVARAERTLQRCHAFVARLESELSEFLPDSPVARLNSAAPGSRIAAPDSLLEVLELSETVRQRSGGAFDCAAKSRVGAPGKRVEWSRASGEAWTVAPGTHIGFGAIGKGYALDQVRRELACDGFHDYLLDAGGSSIVLSGFAAPELPWEFGWSWRRDADGDLVGIGLEHATGETIALGVSGLMEQKRHLLDPRRGVEAGGLQSALVAHPSAALADALSTALFVLGWDEGMSRVTDGLAEPALAVVDAQEVPAWNGIFQKLWGSPMGSALAGLAIWLMTSAVPALAQDATTDEAVDLELLGLSTFTPYIMERNHWWILFPVAVLAAVALHLPFSWNKRKARR